MSDGNTADHIDEDVPHDLHIKNKSLLQESSDVGPEMAQSLEMVHDFGANEMPCEENEGISPAPEGTILLLRVRVMVFNTFNNISVISW